MHINCTNKTFEIASILRATDPVLLDPFILHTINIRVGSLHGYKMLAPICEDYKVKIYPVETLLYANSILPMEVYMLRLATYFQC